MILVVITVVLCIILCILHIFSTIKSYSDDTNMVKAISIPEIENEPNYYSIEEILTSLDCKDIAYTFENDYEKGRYYKINLTFPCNLYEGTESKKNYFDKVVKILSQKLNYSFEIIDEKKDIDIFYDVEERSYTINGIKDYYKNNSYVKLHTHKEINYIRGIEESLELNSIISNGWQRYKLKLDAELIGEDEEFLDYGNFRINYSDININFIEFLDTYEGTVYENIEVGTSFDKIKGKLGKPTFENGNKMIGYKDDTVYLFFYKDKIVAYPTSSSYQFENLNLENDILDYYNGTYKEGRSLFVKHIIEEYVDFESELIDNGVKVSSYLRGIELYLFDDDSIKIVFYDNYRLNSSLKNLAETNKVDLNYDYDSIYLHEINRK